MEAYESRDIEEAARIAREALDQGDAAYPYHDTDPIWGKLWPHGIEPDGSPTSYPHDDAWSQTW
ncbi:hypothetical protein [Streptomyces sp. NPDC001292]|uniref:hypothetical protein n=1 Tax=Streptomyces sp. NPDC001292 TaxID=3364558 RepID=UPI003695E576